MCCSVQLGCYISAFQLNPSPFSTLFFRTGLPSVYNPCSLLPESALEGGARSWSALVP
uniref:Uncharacterized protein n=1 Tax=Arion vulgaris TaxID=1028688 RepID=A0A0B7BAW4_9EUPU